MKDRPMTTSPLNPASTPSTPRRVAMIFGGASSEHDVSISSASQVVLGLAALAAQTPFSLVPIYINRDGRWIWAHEAAPGEFPDREFILAAPRWEFDDNDHGIRIHHFPEALHRL